MVSKLTMNEFSNMSQISKTLSFLHPELVARIEGSSTVQKFPEDTEILIEGQYVKVIPIVLEGLVKVFTRIEDKELLLYYIRPQESCIMSFSSSLTNDPSRVFAKTEEDSSLLLLPADEVSQWIHQFPSINDLFYQQYDLRYFELLKTINHVIFDKMDTRLYDYLKEKSELTHQNPVRISHREIASELGTAREVISRVMKKLENEGKVIQHVKSIEIR